MTDHAPAERVRALRDFTGAGIMECKEALIAAEGDFDRAATIAREKGASRERAERVREHALADAAQEKELIRDASERWSAVAAQRNSTTTVNAWADNGLYRWEYMRVTVIHGTNSRGKPISTLHTPDRDPVEIVDVIPCLRRFGAEGWELVSVVTSSPQSVESYFLKRRY